jgi:hypothetical protein
MANPDRAKLPSQAARDQFARTLHIWRVRAGWAHDTMDRWGEAAGFPRVKNSVFSKLERGMVEQPAPMTFIQLAMANDRLARKEYGAITDRKLRDMVQAQEPITAEDGRPWNEADFFGHFCGVIDPPPWAEGMPLMSPQEAERITEQQREIFTAYAKSLMLPPAQAFDQLQAHCKGMSPEQVQRFKEVLGGWHVWTPEELDEMTNGAGQVAPAQALFNWCDEDDLCRQFRSMCPD